MEQKIFFIVITTIHFIVDMNISLSEHKTFEFRHGFLFISGMFQIQHVAFVLWMQLLL